jgi:hypothetical protein
VEPAFGQPDSASGCPFLSHHCHLLVVLENANCFAQGLLNERNRRKRKETNNLWDLESGLLQIIIGFSMAMCALPDLLFRGYRR